jgi:hypothetical protein
MIIDPKLLQPILQEQSDPFATMASQVDVWVAANLPEYMGTWNVVKSTFLRRILKLGKSGSYLRGQGSTAPHHLLGSAIQSIYELVGSSVYYTSYFWRAYSYWLSKGKFNPRWPLFGEGEVRLACSILTTDEKRQLKQKASDIWKNVFDDTKAMNELIRHIEPQIKRMCSKKIRFLVQYDASLSIEDLYQDILCDVMVVLRNNDTFCDDLMANVGWIIRCAENAIQNKRSNAQASKRSRIASSEEGMSNKQEVEFNRLSNQEEVNSFCLEDLLRLHQGDLSKEIEDTDSAIFLGELIKKADPKISTYLRAVCEGKYNPDFWTWFYHHEPLLAQRDVYRGGDPEALGPFIQRHLDLPTWQLTGFLHEHFPDIKAKIRDTPRNRNLLRGVA